MGETWQVRREEMQDVIAQLRLCSSSLTSLTEQQRSMNKVVEHLATSYYDGTQRQMIELVAEYKALRAALLELREQAVAERRELRERQQRLWNWVLGLLGGLAILYIPQLLRLVNTGKP